MIKNELDTKKDIIYNPDARKIMLECFNAPRSLKEISYKHDIPIAETYHIASKLTKYGYITPIDKVKRNGKRTQLYKTISSNVLVETKENGLKMRMNFEGEEVKMVETAI